jgi:hypothetical protein
VQVKLQRYSNSKTAAKKSRTFFAAAGTAPAAAKGIAKTTPPVK